MAWGGVNMAAAAGDPAKPRPRLRDAQPHGGAQPWPPARLAASAVEVAELQGPLRELAKQLQSLAEARARTAASISAVCEVALGQASAHDALQRLRDDAAVPHQLMPVEDGQTAGGYQQHAFEGSPQPSAKDDSPLFSVSTSPIEQESMVLTEGTNSKLDVPVIQVFSPSSAERRHSMPPSFLTSVSTEQADGGRRRSCGVGEDVWCAEMIARIRASLERSSRDPREVFYRCCRDGEEFMYRADLGRLLTTFELDLPAELHRRLWIHLGKAGEFDVLTYDEFRKLFGPCVQPPPPAAPSGRLSFISPAPIEQPVSPSVASEVSPARSLRSSFSSWIGLEGDGGSVNASMSGMPRFGDASQERSPQEEQREHICLYRLGQALLQDTSGQIRADLTKERSPRRKSSSNPGANIQEALQIFSRHRTLLSRAEVTALLCLHSNNGQVRPDINRVVVEALEAAKSVLPEVAWAQQAIASAGLAARADSAPPLAIELARLGDAASEQDLRHLLGEHAQLEEDSWETLFLVLDKRSDGKVLMEPLVQWAAGIGITCHEAEPQVFSVQDMFDSPRSSNGEPGEHPPAGDQEDKAPEFKWTNMVLTSPVRSPVNSHKRLSAVQEGDSDDASSVSNSRAGSRRGSHQESPGFANVSEVAQDAQGEGDAEDEDLDPFAPISFSFT